MTYAPLFENDTEPTLGAQVKSKAGSIAFIAGNLFLLVVEYRVYDYVFQSTGEVWKGITASLATFIPFLIWENSAQHEKNTGGMTLLSFVGMAMALALAGYTSVADFLLIDGVRPDANTLLTLIAVAAPVHGVMFLVYFYSHPDISASRAQARAKGKEELRRQNAERANGMLSLAAESAARRQELNAKYGEDNVNRALAQLEGKKYEPPVAEAKTNPTQAVH